MWNILKRAAGPVAAIQVTPLFFFLERAPQQQLASFHNPILQKYLSKVHRFLFSVFHLTMPFAALCHSFVSLSSSLARDDESFARNLAKVTASHEDSMLLEEPLSASDDDSSEEEFQVAPRTETVNHVKWPTLPEAISVEGVELSGSTNLDPTGAPLYRNGHGVRTIRAPFGYNLHIYVATLYTEYPVRTERDVQLLLDRGEGFVMEFTFLRSVSPSQMSIAWNYQLDTSVTEGNYPTYPEDRRSFLELLDGSMEEGGNLRFEFRIDERRMVLINQGKYAGEIVGTDFSKAFCSMWFGDQPVMEEIKVGLLKGGPELGEADGITEERQEENQAPDVQVEAPVNMI